LHTEYPTQDPQACKGDAFAYDGRDQKTSVTDEDGYTTGYRYDQVGHLTGVTDPTGATTSSTFDWAGRTLTMTAPPTAAAPSGAVTSYRYDPAGRLVATTDPLGRVTTFGFDAAGRRTNLAAPGRGTTSYRYDANGRVVGVTNGAGETSTSTYDPMGRVTARRDALGRTTTFELDVLGRQTAVTDPTGAVTTQGYDAAGQLAVTLDPTLGQLTTTDTRQPNATGTQGWSQYSYTNNNPTTYTDPTGHVAVMEHGLLQSQSKREEPPLATAGQRTADRLRRLANAVDELCLAVDILLDACPPNRQTTNPEPGPDPSPDPSPDPRPDPDPSPDPAPSPGCQGPQSQCPLVLLDANAVIAFQAARLVIGPGEQPVVTPNIVGEVTDVGRRKGFVGSLPAGVASYPMNRALYFEAKS
jgi:RHS repeat-associated protein